MNDLEIAVRQILREEIRSALDEILPRLTSLRATMQPERGSELLISAREAAKRLALSQSTLFKLTKSGQLPCVRVGMSKRYSVDALKKWIVESTTESAASSDLGPPKTASSYATKRGHRSRRVKLSTPAGTTAKQPHPNLMDHDATEENVSVQRETRPFSLLLAEIGVDRSDLPPIKNSDLSRIAEVDTPTLHGWQYRRRPLPEAAIEKLRAHFLKYRKPE